MEHSNRRYNEEEVSEIVRRALSSRSGPRDTIGHDELVDIARSTGISRSQLEASIEDQELTGQLDFYKEKWVKRHRKDFFDHFRVYIIVNAALTMMNLFVSPRYLWVMWVILGWGIGVALQASSTFFVSDETIERGALRMMKKERKRREKYEDFMEEY
jgi:hypothetical protein